MPIDSKDSDELIFLEEDEDRNFLDDETKDRSGLEEHNTESQEIFELKPLRSNSTWQILICDDDLSVHTVTKLALEEFKFAGKELEIISAFSGAEGIKVVEQNPDIAVILQDVIMETNDAGLQAVKYIREVLQNHLAALYGLSSAQGSQVIFLNLQ